MGKTRVGFCVCSVDCAVGGGEKIMSIWLCCLTKRQRYICSTLSDGRYVRNLNKIVQKNIPVSLLILCSSLSLVTNNVRHGLVVRIAGSHPAGPGSIPGGGINFFCHILLTKLRN